MEDDAGGGGRRECEEDAGQFQDDAGMTWPLDSPSPRPLGSERVPRFLCRVPGL